MIKEYLSTYDMDYESIVVNSTFKVMRVFNSKETKTMHVTCKDFSSTTINIKSNQLVCNNSMSTIAYKNLYLAGSEPIMEQFVEDGPISYQAFIDANMNIKDGESYTKAFSFSKKNEANYELTLITVNKQDMLLEIPVLPIKITDNNGNVIFKDFVNVDINAVPYKFAVNIVDIPTEKFLVKEFDLSTWEVMFTTV